MKNCNICKKEIIPTGSGHDYQRKYCGRSCKDKNQSLRRNKTLAIREYKRLWAQNHPEVGAAWRAANPERVKESMAKANLRSQGYPDEFHAVKYLVKARDRNACVDCGEKDRKKLVVHHHDRNKQNNDMSNLFTVCIRCHGLRHRKEFLTIRTNPNQRGAFL